MKCWISGERLAAERMPTPGSLKELQLNLTGVNEKLVSASCSLQLIVVLMKKEKKRLLLHSLSTHRAQFHSQHSTRVILSCSPLSWCFHRVRSLLALCIYISRCRKNRSRKWKLTGHSLRPTWRRYGHGTISNLIAASPSASISYDLDEEGCLISKVFEGSFLKEGSGLASCKCQPLARNIFVKQWLLFHEN